jgi:hypothetical protein
MHNNATNNTLSISFWHNPAHRSRIIARQKTVVKTLRSQQRLNKILTSMRIIALFPSWQQKSLRTRGLLKETEMLYAEVESENATLVQQWPELVATLACESPAFVPSAGISIRRLSCLQQVLFLRDLPCSA